MILVTIRIELAKSVETLPYSFEEREKIKFKYGGYKNIYESIDFSSSGIQKLMFN